MIDSFGHDVLEQYKQISNKLKKRFLRKPNVTEACESFTQLGQQCENIEMPAYAGLCWIAAARCEGSLGNIPGETSCLVRSARQFIKAEENNEKLGCPGPSGENIQAALSCYSHASSRYPENSPLTISLNLEIIESLKNLNRKDSLEFYLKNIVDVSKNSLDTQLFCLDLLASHYIETNDFTSALETYTEMATLLENSPLNGARSDEVLKCEINRILVLLILRPAPQKLAPNLAQLLEKYTWGDQSDRNIKACGMPEVLFVLIQSLVLTCQSLDTSALPRLEGELWRYFSKDQKCLMRTLVDVYS